MGARLIGALGAKGALRAKTGADARYEFDRSDLGPVGGGLGGRLPLALSLDIHHAAGALFSEAAPTL